MQFPILRDEGVFGADPLAPKCSHTGGIEASLRRMVSLPLPPRIKLQRIVTAPPFDVLRAGNVAFGDADQVIKRQSCAFLNPSFRLYLQEREREGCSGGCRFCLYHLWLCSSTAELFWWS